MNRRVTRSESGFLAWGKAVACAVCLEDPTFSSYSLQLKVLKWMVGDMKDIDIFHPQEDAVDCTWNDHYSSKHRLFHGATGPLAST